MKAGPRIQVTAERRREAERSCSLRRIVRRGLSFLTHPIWHYSPREILRCVREDWEGVGSRAELEDLIKHMDIHSNYRRCGYDHMTTMQKYIFTETARKPWSSERGDSPNQ